MHAADPECSGSTSKIRTLSFAITALCHRVKPAEYAKVYKYFPIGGVAEDVFQMIEKWRGTQEEE